MMKNERLLIPQCGLGPEFERLLIAKLGDSRTLRILHQDVGLDRLLSLVSAGYGTLLVLEGATGAHYDGVTYREVRDDEGSTRLNFAAYWRETNSNPTLGPFLAMLKERYPDLSGAPPPTRSPLSSQQICCSPEAVTCADWGAVYGDVVAWRIVAVSACALVGVPATWASGDSNGETSTSNQAQPAFSDAWKQISDPEGIRSRLEQAGLQFTFTYYGDPLGNLSGGVKQGLGYSGRFGTIVDADLEKLVGWSGAAFHASIHQIQGSGVSANNLENLMVVSGIEAPASSRLFNLCRGLWRQPSSAAVAGVPQRPRDAAAGSLSRPCPQAVRQTEQAYH